MKKVLVTGGAGFIGSNFLNKYVLANPDVDFINIDCLTYAGKLENINEEEAMKDILNKIGIDMDEEEEDN